MDVLNLFKWLLDACGVYMARFVDYFWMICGFDSWVLFLVSAYSHRFKMKPQNWAPFDFTTESDPSVESYLDLSWCYISVICIDW